MGDMLPSEKSTLISFDLSRAFERADCQRILLTLLAWKVHPELINLVRLLTYRGQFEVELRNGKKRLRAPARTSKRGARNDPVLGRCFLPRM